MTKTLALTISVAIAVLGFAAAAAPTQAAIRLMNSSVDGFEYRCERHGGVFGQDGTTVSCQTPTVPVACEYTTGRQAICEWEGRLNQIAVIRVIGTLPAGYTPTGNGHSGSGLVADGGNGGGGMGLQGPKDFGDAPDNDPTPNFNGPKDFQMKP